MKIIGRGRPSDGRPLGQDGARAYWGLTMPGYPNFFCLFGPNTGRRTPARWRGGRCKSAYALQCFEAMIAHGWKAIDVREDAYESFNRDVDERLSTSVWFEETTRSPYINAHGRICLGAPWRTLEYCTNTLHPDLSDYIITRPMESTTSDLRSLRGLSPDSPDRRGVQCAQRSNALLGESNQHRRRVDAMATQRVDEQGHVLVEVRKRASSFRRVTPVTGVDARRDASCRTVGDHLEEGVRASRVIHRRRGRWRPGRGSRSTPRC